jgi:hypothetical protein
MDAIDWTLLAVVYGIAIITGVVVHLCQRRNSSEGA